MFSVSRKNDAVISVCQDNGQKTIEIQAMNAAAESLTGYEAHELVGKPLAMLLPEAIRDIVDSYIEFEDGGKDLAAVLGKTRKFRILNKMNASLAVDLKIYHVAAPNKNLNFQLLIRDSSFSARMMFLREAFPANMMPDREFFGKCLELVIASAEENKITCHFALLTITGFHHLMDGLPAASIGTLLSVVNTRYNTTSRVDDTIAYLGDGKIGLLMIDCAPDNIMEVLRRVFTSITEAPIVLPSGESLFITLESRVTPVTKQIELAELIASCEPPSV